MSRIPAVLMGAAAFAMLLTACARETKQTTTVTTTTTHGVMENPSSFPLYPQSTVVQVVPVDSKQMLAAIKASDPSADVPKNFRGHEVIAESSASLAQLEGWVQGLKTSPPAGLHTVELHNNFEGRDKRETALAAQFESASGDRTVYVVVADPKKLRGDLGPLFTLIENYNAVPGMLRGAIDEQSKKQVGYSVTELLDAKGPVGAVIAQVRRMQDTGHRGILLIDEARAK